MRRLAALATLAALCLAACGTTTTSDHGVADEPTRIGVVACSTPVESDLYLRALDQLRGEELDSLTARCDYRRTGEACHEEQLCATAQINDTGRFER